MYLSVIFNYVLPMHSSRNLKTRTASFLLSECNFLQPFALHPSRPRRLPQSSTVISCYIHWKHDELIHAIRYVNKASRPSQTLQIKKICLTPFTVNIIFSALLVKDSLDGDLYDSAHTKQAACITFVDIKFSEEEKTIKRWSARSTWWNESSHSYFTFLENTSNIQVVRQVSLPWARNGVMITWFCWPYKSVK